MEDPFVVAGAFGEITSKAEPHNDIIYQAGKQGAETRKSNEMNFLLLSRWDKIIRNVSQCLFEKLSEEKNWVALLLVFKK